MIGVVARAGELPVVEELFELFKTAWEPAVVGRQYRAIVASDARTAHQHDADHIFIYSSNPDQRELPPAERFDGPAEIDWNGSTIPVYGQLACFTGPAALNAMCGGRPVSGQFRRGNRVTHWIGYDLFAEVNRLITVGQPPQHAARATLELHIAMLRSLFYQ
jgi:hypothetical protein